MKTRPVPRLWDEALTAFTETIRAGGIAETTIATRTNHIRRMSRQLGPDPALVTADTLVRWAGRQDWAIETRRSFRATARAFYGWMHRTGRAPVNAADALPRVAPATPVPRPAPDIAYLHAMSKADERCRLILSLAAEIGLRRAEISQVNTRDLIDDLTGTSLVVHGKGGKVRVVPLPDPLAAQLRKGAAGHTPGMSPTGYVFPGDEDGHLSARWVGKLAAQLLPSTYTLHTLRHRFATRAYAHARDTFAVQSLLGHASPVTTRRYVQVPNEHLRETVRAVAG